MDILIKIALWAHFMAIGVGGAATFGIPMIGRIAPTAPPEARPAIGAAIDLIAGAARKAMGVLILSGLFLVWARYDIAAMPGTFWAKMGLVALMIGLMVVNVRTGKRARRGDGAAAARLPALGKAGMATFALIVLMAVIAFL